MEPTTRILIANPGDLIAAIVMGGLILWSIRNAITLIVERIERRRNPEPSDHDRGTAAYYADRDYRRGYEFARQSDGGGAVPPADDDAISIDEMVSVKQYRKALHALIAHAVGDGLDSRLRHDMREASRRRR